MNDATPSTFNAHCPKCDMRDWIVHNNFARCSDCGYIHYFSGPQNEPVVIQVIDRKILERRNRVRALVHSLLRSTLGMDLTADELISLANEMDLTIENLK